MEPYRQIYSTNSDPIFNVVETFTRALHESRRARGEPEEGILRQAWEVKQWVNQNPRNWVKTTAIALAVVGGIVVLRRRLSSKVRRMDIQHEWKAA